MAGKVGSRLTVADRLLLDAPSVAGLEQVIEVDQWASGWLGQAWLAAEIGDPEVDHRLCEDVVQRARRRPTPEAGAAVAALRRVVAPAEWALLDSALEVLPAGPSWLDAPALEPTAARRTVDVWDSEHVVFVDFGGSRPHALMARVSLGGGTRIDKLGLADPGAAASGNGAGPAVECSVDEALTEIAHALRLTDLSLPRPTGEDFVNYRALVWSRCRDHLPEWRDEQPMSEAERTELLDAFTPAGDTVDRSLAEVFLDFGEGYLGNRPLCWSPHAVRLFLTDWLPREVVLDIEQYDALPGALRRWVRFALLRRGVDPQWIEPVLAEIDHYLG
jgi:hypothetical protein